MREPAAIREQVYTDPRPAAYFERFHERARTREPDWVYEVARVLTSLYAFTVLRTRTVDVEHVPGCGPVILAPNHFSFMDHFLIACYLRRKVRFMAKSQLFKAPMQFVFTHAGCFPVRRGAGDEETFITAEAILRRGGALAMYCEGGRSRTGDIGVRAKPGIGRLALQSGVPVVPIAIHGSARIRNWRRMQFPKVTVRYGPPICWEPVEQPTREQQQAVADAILLEIRALHASLQQHPRRARPATLRARHRGSPGVSRARALTRLGRVTHRKRR